MRLGRSALQTLLGTNAAELRFKRRLEKRGFNVYRRMLCTRDQRLLLSEPAKRIFFYRPPHGYLKYDPAAKNLVVTFDIFMLNWRMINCNDVDIIAVIPTSPDSSKFWAYFYDSIKHMSAEHKARFMNT